MTEEKKPLNEFEVIEWLKKNRELGISTHFAPKEVQNFILENPSILDRLDILGNWVTNKNGSNASIQNVVYSLTSESVFYWKLENHKFDSEDRSNLAFEGLDDSLVKQITGDKHRWQTEITSIFKVGDRLFAIDWMEGNTENQENEYDLDPYEVEAKEVTIVTYVRKSDGKILEEVDSSDDEEDELPFE